MTHVITRTCCNDAACVEVCPVDCIRPRPGDPGFSTAENLYIDPSSCIDCGACAEVCPVGAIVTDRVLDDAGRAGMALAESWFAQVHPPRLPGRVPARTTPRPAGGLRVAVVGTGPSGYYAAQELLERTAGEVQVSMFDRLPVPGGLVRYGVAPDHGATRTFGDGMERLLRRPQVRLHLNVEVGPHVSAAELLDRHHAVVHAVGAAGERRLGIPGEDLPGSHSARDLVHWYNGHPDHAGWAPSLDTTRAVVIGNGNVALDLARMLVTDPEELATTDIAPPALHALRRSRIREVQVVGRRDPARGAFSTPELLGLDRIGGVQVLVADSEAVSGPAPEFAARTKAKVVARFAGRVADPARRRIVLRFGRTPREILGGDGVRAVRFGTADGGTEDVECGLVLRATGFRGVPVAGLPFDDERSAVPHEAGRVLAGPVGPVVAGHYVTGWIKRGPSGVIGTNRTCAAETVGSLLADHAAGGLVDPAPTAAEDLDRLLAARRPERIGLAGWRAIDRAERLGGRGAGAPRRRIVTVEGLLAAARAEPGHR
ncbi:4Fe-4S binding protein [Pseudonocardia sp. ICBG601]|uniref:4Fe-4S binding protein n=1 Tax=Pseudonocardia sp. ICBG601 TaxID=2846759 RepID=UPI001CF65C9F|nr:4Fe-4S binding protein [Pseudonocardia sp. ICBG601]